MTLDADEFIRRFLLHVLPDGFRRIRHFGFLANACRAAKLAQHPRRCSTCPSQPPTVAARRLSRALRDAHRPPARHLSLLRRPHGRGGLVAAHTRRPPPEPRCDSS